MRVLVTGGAGYIGSVLVPTLLANGHHARVLDSLLYGGSSLLNVWSHPRFEFIHGDIRDAKVVKRSLHEIDAVVHLAAIVGDTACARKPILARSVNLDASLALFFESVRMRVPRFVFASTCSNYGKMYDPSQYVDETSELCPLSLYAATKVEAERIMYGLIQSEELCKTALRFATVYGVSPRMRFDLTVNEFTMEMLTKKHLVVYGEQLCRPYIHVRDVARAILLVLDAPVERVRDRIFNVGSNDQNYHKKQVIEFISPYAPDAIVEYVHKNEDPRDYRVSFTRIKVALGFEITHTIQNGIGEVARLVKDGIIQDFSDPRFRN